MRMDTPLAIVLLCDGDRATSDPRIKDGLKAWSLNDAVKAHKAMVGPEWEKLMERETRLAGRYKGLRFRRYEHWGLWSIKVYGDASGTEPRDFATWEEACEWVGNYEREDTNVCSKNI